MIKDMRGRQMQGGRVSRSTSEGHRLVIKELLSGRFKSVSKVRPLHENVILSD